MGVSESSFAPVYDEVYHYCNLTTFASSSNPRECHLHGVIEGFAGKVRTFEQGRSSSDEKLGARNLLNRVNKATGHTPLTIACDRGNRNAVEILLSSGLVDPNLSTKTGDSPVLVACDRPVVAGSTGDQQRRQDYQSILKLLLGAKADVCAQNQRGDSALHCAIKHANYKASKLLLQHKADVSLTNNQRQTPLLLSVASCGDVKKSKDVGISASSKKVKSRTKKREKFEKLLHSLLDAKSDPKTKDREGVSPLLLATSYGLTSVVDALLKSKAELHVPNSHGITPLMAAVLRSRVNTLQHLCNSKANVAQRGPDGDDALALALSKGRNTDKKVQMVSILITAKADPNGRNSNPEYSSAHGGGHTPLHLAASTGCANCIDLLLTSKADLNSVGGPTGRTPLSCAVSSKSLAAVRTLLVAGGYQPDVDIKTNEIERLTQLCSELVVSVTEANEAIKTAANEERFDEIAALTAQRQEKQTRLASLQSDLEAKEQDVAAAALAVETENVRVINFNAVCSNGRTALMYGASNPDSSEIVEILLKAKAEPDFRGGHGFTAIGVAVFSNNPHTVELLLRHGADVHQTMPTATAHNLIQVLCVSPACHAERRDRQSKAKSQGWTSADIERMQHSDGDAGNEAAEDQSVDSDDNNRAPATNQLDDPVERFGLILQLLIKSGAGVKEFHAQEPDSGRTALMLACATGNFRMVLKLVQVANQALRQNDAPPSSTEDIEDVVGAKISCHNGKLARHYAEAAYHQVQAPEQQRAFEQCKPYIGLDDD